MKRKIIFIVILILALSIPLVASISKIKYELDYISKIEDIMADDLEIEFENHEIANKYETPDWVIKDVTGDLNYKNGHLARYGIPESYYNYTK